MTIDRSEFRDRLRGAARRAETGDCVRLDGLTPEELYCLNAAAAEDGQIGAFDVTGLDDEAFIAYLRLDRGKTPTPEQLETGRKLLTERRTAGSPR